MIVHRKDYDNLRKMMKMIKQGMWETDENSPSIILLLRYPQCNGLEINRNHVSSFSVFNSHGLSLLGYTAFSDRPNGK